MTACWRGGSAVTVSVPPTEDLCWIVICDSSSKVSDALSDLFGQQALTHTVPMYTCRKNTHAHKIAK